MNHSAKQHSSVRTCVFFSVHFCDGALALVCDHTDLLKWLMWRSNGFASNSALNLTRWLQKHTQCLKKHLVVMPKAQRKLTNGLSVSRTDGCQSMMIILDDLRPEPWPKMWQKFDIEGIVHKEFVPPGQMVNGKILLRHSEVTEGTHSAQTSRQVAHQLWALNHDDAQAHVTCCVAVFGFYEGDGHLHPP